MFNWFAGDSNERELKKLAPLVKRINDLEPGFQQLKDEELKGKTSEFRQALADSATGGAGDANPRSSAAWLNPLAASAISSASCRSPCSRNPSSPASNLIR